jgi:hypothetical protein
MASRSDAPSRVRARPSAELLARLRQGKAQLRQEREGLPLREKVRQVLELQRVQHALLARRGALETWQRPWEIEP